MNKVMLNPQQKHHLVNWLLANVKNFDGRTKESVATEATDQLGFECTPWHVHGIKRDFDLNWKPASGPVEGSKKTDAIKAINEKLDRLSKQMDIICGQLGVDCGKLGDE